MSKRLYKLTKSGEPIAFVSPTNYYTMVLNNPKANARVRKKASDILATIAGLNGWASMHKAATGNFSFSDWQKARRKQRSRRNTGGMARLHPLSVPLLSAYRRYIEIAKMTYP